MGNKPRLEYPWKAGDVVVYKQANGPALRIARIIDGHVDQVKTMRVYLRRSHDLRAIYGEWTTTPTRLSISRILRHATDEDLGTWKPTPPPETPMPEEGADTVLPTSIEDLRFAQVGADIVNLMYQSRDDLQAQYLKDRRLMTELDNLMRIAEDDNEASKPVARESVVERAWAHAQVELPEPPTGGLPYTCTEVIDLLFMIEEYVLERQRSAQEILNGRRYPDTKRSMRGWHESE